MLNNKMHGLGTYFFSSGSKLTCYFLIKLINICLILGTFVNGMAIGKGKYEHPDGCIYQGDIYMNKKNGKGVEKFDNGDYFVGEFESGERKSGIYTSIDGFEYHGPY